MMQHNSQEYIIQTLDRALFVSAGAGSGKTYTLTQRIAHALKKGSAKDGTAFLKSIKEVLVITFTSAAAREIRERVRMTLRSFGLDQAQEELDEAWISTIHGMCARILRQHALDATIDPNFCLCPEILVQKYKKQAVNEVFKKARTCIQTSRLFSEYSGDFLEKIINQILLGAEKLSGGVEDLYSFNGPHSQRLFEQELSELKSQFEFLLSLKLSDAARAVTQNAYECVEDVLSNNSDLFDNNNYENIQKRLDDIKLPRSSKVIENLLPDIKYQLKLIKAEYTLLSAAAFTPAIMKLATQVQERFNVLKKRDGYLDNNDLIRLTLDLLSNNPHIAKSYAERFRLVMVDEFQDTDTTQLRLLHLLTQGDLTRVCTVGDAQQSIYLFRGADVSVFRNYGDNISDDGKVLLTKNYRSHKEILSFVEAVCARQTSVSEHPLLADFMHLDSFEKRQDGYRARSLPRISLEVLGALAARGKGIKAGEQKKLSAELLAKRIRAYVDAGTPPRDIALLLGKMQNTDQAYIEALRSEGLSCVVSGGSGFSVTPEVKVISALLHTLANPSDTQAGLFPLLSSDMFGLSANDFCLLGTAEQKNNTALTKRPIQIGLFEGIFARFKQPSPQLYRACRILTEACKNLAHKGVADVCLDVLIDSGWLSRLSSHAKSAQAANNYAQAANLLAAIRYIRELGEDLCLGVGSLAKEFDRWLAEAKKSPALLAGEDSGNIQIMTIHASKGLQFPVVAVAECWGDADVKSNVFIGDSIVEKQKCPSILLTPAASQRKIRTGSSCQDALSELRKSALKEQTFSHKNTGSAAEFYLKCYQDQLQKEQAEKARLLYVAMTRAKEALIVGVNASYTKDGDIASQLAAQFMDALHLPFDTTQIERSDSFDYGGDEKGFVHLFCPKEEKDYSHMSFTVPDESTYQTKDFTLYEQVKHPCFTISPTSLTDGVFSYSSLQKQQELLESQKEKISQNELYLSKSVEQEDIDKKTIINDVDKATNIGSAFHSLAELMIKMRHDPTQQQIEATCRFWQLSEKARVRLREALKRWCRSNIRKKILTHTYLFAEYPFFVSAPDAYKSCGTYVQGAFDLLATDEPVYEDKDKVAFLVDYKTGDLRLSASEIKMRHKKQAELYSHILHAQGFKRVYAYFVCVERDAGQVCGSTPTGEPYVVEFEF